MEGLMPIRNKIFKTVESEPLDLTKCGTATQSDVLEGVIFTSENGIGLVGTLPDFSKESTIPSDDTSDSFMVKIPYTGVYDPSTSIYIPVASIVPSFKTTSYQYAVSTNGIVNNIATNTPLSPSVTGKIYFNYISTFIGSITLNIKYTRLSGASGTITLDFETTETRTTLTELYTMPSEAGDILSFTITVDNCTKGGIFYLVQSCF